MVVEESGDNFWTLDSRDADFILLLLGLTCIMMSLIDLIQESLHVAEKEEKKKVKRPTALKRDITSRKKCLRNKAFKSRVRTAIKAYQASLTQDDKALSEKSLSEVYSLVDKGVKTGVYKKNASSRMKSRMAVKLLSS